MTTKLNFGMTAINAVRNADEAALVIATSTKGQFRLTPKATAMIGLRPGDYIKFYDNKPTIEMAIDQHLISADPAISEFCEANDIDITTPQGKAEFIKANRTIGVAKGYPLFKSSGMKDMTNARITEDDKVVILSNSYQEYLEMALEQLTSDDSEKGIALREALSKENLSMEEGIELLKPFVVGEEIQRYEGYKLASSSKNTSTGLTLTCSDGTSHANLTEDLQYGFNREFNVDGNFIDIEAFDGFKTISLRVYTLGTSNDVPVSRRGESSKADEEAEKAYKNKSKRGRNVESETTDSEPVVDNNEEVPNDEI